MTALSFHCDSVARSIDKLPHQLVWTPPDAASRVVLLVHAHQIPAKPFLLHASYIVQFPCTNILNAAQTVLLIL